MGTCTLSFEHAAIQNHKSDAHHADNDWLGLIWIVDGDTITRTYQITDQAGSDVLNDGSALHFIADSIDCDDTAVVTVLAVVMNLSSIDRDKQVQAATTFVQQVADVIVPIYIEAGATVLGLAATLGAPAIAAAISTATAALLDKFSDAIVHAMDDAFEHVLTPILQTVVEEVAWLLGGQPNCNGEVLHDSFVFLPRQERYEFIRDKTYTGPQTNSHCGMAPHTIVTWWLYRHVTPLYDPLPNQYVPGLISALSPRTVHVPSDASLSADHETLDLLWYNHRGIDEGIQDWQGPRTLGTDWNFRQVFPGVHGVVYAVDNAGTLLWYRNAGYRAGLRQWSGPKKIGSGWNIPLVSPAPSDFIGAFCESAYDMPGSVTITVHPPPPGQIIYGVKADGTLWWYRHELPGQGDSQWANDGAGKQVGEGWVAGHRWVFSAGSGIIYVITEDGTLLWYRHKGSWTGEAQWDGPRTVNTGWDGMVDAFALAGGFIYAIDQQGVLWWSHHDDYLTGGTTMAQRRSVGTGWNANGFSVVANRVSLQLPHPPA
jgi:hypothetical protein